MSVTVKLNSGMLAAFIICVTPFIDVTNVLIGIGGSVSFGQIVRVALLLLMHFVLLKEDPFHALLIILLTAAFGFREALYSVAYGVSFMRAVIYDVYYIYVLTFFALLMRAIKAGYFGKEELKSLSKRFALMTALSVILSRLLGMGLEYSNTGIQRLFGSANALTATLVWGAALWLYEAFYGERTLKSVLASVLVLYGASSQGTKAGVFGSFVCIGFILFYSLFVRRNPLKSVLLIGFGCIAAVALYYYFTRGGGMLVLARWRYFIIHESAAMSFLLSDRNTKLFRGMSLWIKDRFAPFIGFNFPYVDYQTHLIAPGSNYAAAEMDIFDLFLFYGLFIGAFFSFHLTRRAFRCASNLLRGKKDCCDDFCYLIFYSLMFLGGHVLNSPFAGVAFCLSYALAGKGRGYNDAALVLLRRLGRGKLPFPVPDACPPLSPVSPKGVRK